MPKPTRRVFPFSKHRSRIADLVSRPICESPQTKAHNTPQKRSRPLRRSSQVNLPVTHNFDALADMLAQWAKAVRRKQRRAEARSLESRERPWQPRSEHFVAIGPPKRRSAAQRAITTRCSEPRRLSTLAFYEAILTKTQVFRARSAGRKEFEVADTCDQSSARCRDRPTFLEGGARAFASKGARVLSPRERRTPHFYNPAKSRRSEIV